MKYLLLIAMVLMLLMGGFMWGAMNTQNKAIEDKIDLLQDGIDLIVDYKLKEHSDGSN